MSRLNELLVGLTQVGVPHFTLGRVARYSDSRVGADELDRTSFVGVDNLLADKGGRADANYLPNTARLTAFVPGDVLIGNIRPYLKKVWLSDRFGGCSGDVLVVRVAPEFEAQLTPEFLYYVLSSDRFFAYNMQHAKGAKMPRGDKKAILSYQVPVPPLEVQHEIVRILDQFTQLEAELEAELEARRKQYGYHLETLLQSGPDIPRVGLGEVATIMRGASPRPIRSFITSREQGLPWIRIGDAPKGGKYITETEQYVTREGASKSRRVLPGDFVLSNSMSFGRPYITKIEGYIHDGWLAISDFSPYFIPDYLYYVLQSAPIQAEFERRAGAGTVRNLNADIVKAVQVPVPDLARQEAVVALLNQFDALVNDLTSGLPAEIAARRKQYEYYRDKLLTFEEAAA